MKTLSILTFVAAIAAFTSVPLLAQETSPSIVRPYKVDAKIGGSQIAKPGSYTVSVGDSLELEYLYSVTPQVMPKELSFKTSESGALDATELVIKNVVAPGLMGAGIKAFCFDAVRPGTERITLKIDGNEYTYSITVADPAGDKANPELCKGAYSAIQFRGKVFIFGNGVHPTAGYQTYFEKAKIAIWPPQFSLMCEKPSGVVAQVLTPFSAQTSFLATDPIESVTISDSDGQHAVKVIQVK